MKQRGFLAISTAYWIVGALLVSGIALLGYGYAKRGEQIDALKGERDSYKELAETRADSLSNMTNANQTNLANVHELSQRLSEAVGENQRIEEALRNARVEAARAKQAATAALDNLRKSRETIYAQDQNCRTWANQPVCPAISDSLREQWGQAGTSGGAPIGFSRGAASSTGPDRPVAD